MNSKRSKLESDTKYRGRFAPSATGPLHLGSIYSALISYLNAKDRGGDWLIRIDDLDSQRCKPQFSSKILQCLDSFNLKPTHSIAFQSDRINLYEKAFFKLFELGCLYTCTCTRKNLKNKSCSGDCRKRLGQELEPEAAIRIETTGMPLNFHDQLQGNTDNQSCVDFIVRRRDGIYAYQLACAVDETIDHINHVVRGIDLMPSTPMQTWIMGKLGSEIPYYAHHPILVDRSGFKLSKQTFASPVDPRKPGETYFKIAQLFRLINTPNENASADTWLQYFTTEVSIDTMLPKVTDIYISRTA